MSQRNSQKTQVKQQKRERDSASDDSFTLSQTDMESIMKKAVMEALHDFRKEIIDTLNAKIAEFKTELDNIGAENEVLKKNVESLSLEVKNHSISIRKNEEELTCLNKKLCDVVRANNANEQYSRKCSLRFHGVKRHDNEVCKNEILDIIRNKLKIRDASEEDIVAAHRVERQ